MRPAPVLDSPHEVPVSPTIETAYVGKTAAEYDQRRFMDPAGLAIHDAELRILRQAAAMSPAEGRFVEVGCGTGRLLCALHDMGYQVDGVDASTEMLATTAGKLAERGLPRRLCVAEGKYLPFADHTYHFAYSIRVLNQTGTPDYALGMVDEILRIVRPGGYALIEFVSKYRPRLRTPGVALAPRQVTERAQRAGAQVVWTRGAFFLGMRSFLTVPTPALGLLTRVDRALAGLAPGVCARCYVLLRKPV